MPLQPLELLRIVAAAGRFLLGELLLRLDEKLLLGRELLLQDLALALLRGGLRGRGFSGKSIAAPTFSRHGPRGRRLLRRHDIDLARYELALLAFRVLLVAGVEGPAAAIEAFVDFRDLGVRERGRRRQHRA